VTTPAPVAAAPAPAPAAGASDPPVRPSGTRARSGNAMQRARGAVLEATAHCVERYGVRRTTMGDIALKAEVAKATLYNHFRTKDDVLAALVEHRVQALVAEVAEVAAGTGLPAALEVAAARVAGSGPLRRLVADDPGLAARLAAPAGGRGWELARDGVRSVLAAAGAATDDAAVGLVLRWLAGQVLWPCGPDESRGQAARLARAVPAG
jgi:AcrR family transcriptional regulator